MKHLVYFTFGEQNGNVYSTQVIQLLNHWSEREGWKITLVQIADTLNFGELKANIHPIFIKRKFKMLLPFQTEYYSSKVLKQLFFDELDDVFFTSRSTSAFSIARSIQLKVSSRVKCNNLDIRGTIEEVKLRPFRKLMYSFIRFSFNRKLQHANSITTVTSNLKNYLEQEYYKGKEVKIDIVPTLSVFSYSEGGSRKNMAYIGKIAWISSFDFVSGICRVNDFIKRYDWNVVVIGNQSANLGLEKYGIQFVDRMTPSKLSEFIKSFYCGLVLRDSSIINKVAAPCKISDYLCLGMPIIFSGSIGSLDDFISLYPDCSRFVLNVDNLDDEEKISEFMSFRTEDFVYLSNVAKSYFGVNSVIDRYISIFSE